jgi:formylglycine-generating enzyme required for sulfatase activity
LTQVVRISSPAGERILDAGDLPLRVGSGADADIRVPGLVTGTTLALIGVLDGRAFVQLADSTSHVLVNDEPLTGTGWLASGDVLDASGTKVRCAFSDDEFKFAIEFSEQQYDTLPPEVAAEAIAESVEIAPVVRRTRSADQGPSRAVRILKIAIYSSLVVLGSVALYIFTSKSVLVDVGGDDPEIALSGGFIHPKVGERYLLRPGEYQLTATAEGYHPLSELISVTGEASQDFVFEMAKLPGRLVIALEPDIDARVLIDDVEVDLRAPEIVLEPGDHDITVTAERFLPFAAVLKIEGRDLLQAFTAVLSPGWADIALETDPAGASILVGGKEVGQSPGTVELMPGSHEILIAADGYKTWRELVRTEAGQVRSLPLITLQEADGIVTVRTRPGDASVTVDGRYRGRSPLDVELPPGKSYKVTIARPGYDTVVRNVNLKERRSRTLTVDLQPQLGVIQVVSDPADAELLIDGRSVGEVGGQLELTATEHTIEIRKPGYETFSTKVTPKPGLPQVIEARLMTPEQAVLAATPTLITTSQGAELQLVRPGADFELGTPRRSQGRRANETQRPVRLSRSFYIGVREVTNAEFRGYIPNHTSGAERYRDLSAEKHPAVMLSWDDAAEYSNWLSDRDGLPRAYAESDGTLLLVDPPTTGYRLPTEAEWVWAIRYSAGGGESRYPWGDRMPPMPESGNYADSSARGFVANVLGGYDDRYPVTAPVGSFPPSPIGLYDAGGNVAEWVNDFYAVGANIPGDVITDPVGPAEGQYRVIRGSSWRHAGIAELRIAYRDFGDQGRLDVGFRLARYSDEALEPEGD